MGDMFSRPTSQASPVFGFDWFKSLLQTGAGQTRANYPSVFGNIDQDIFRVNPGTKNYFDSSVKQAGVSSRLGGDAGLEALLGGLQTGFSPDVLSSVQGKLETALGQQRDRGQAEIREQAAALGVLPSTGTVQAMGDLETGLRSGVLDRLATLEGDAALQGQGIRSQLAQMAFNAPNSYISGALVPALQTSLQSSQFARQLPIQSLQGVSGGVNAFPIQQGQVTGASKGETIIPALASIAGIAIAACWVAAAAWGSWQHPMVYASRRYIRLYAPAWLRRAYMRFGPHVAKVVERSGMLRAAARWAFTRAVRTTLVPQS